MKLKYNNKRIMPLMGSSFETGHATDIIKAISDEDEQNIATAELFYFSGEAKNAPNWLSTILITPIYL